MAETGNHKEDLAWLTLNQLSQLTGVTYRTIKKRLADAKLEPGHKDGRSSYYDPIRALPIIFEVGKKSNGEEEICLSDEQAKLARARTEKTMLETEVLKGNLIPSEIVEAGWIEVFSRAR